MCMLTYYPPTVMPDVEALRNGAEYNRDGHGFAIVDVRHGRIIVRKSMHFESLVETFVKMRRKYPDGPALFHSRFGTGGTVNKFNCHPFRVNRDARTVLGHNGILPPVVHPAKGDKRCDTRIAADWNVPAMFGDLDTVAGRHNLGEWMGKSNKFVILTVDPKFQRHAYIINESSGVWEGETWYSNTDYKSWNRWVAKDYYWTAGDNCPNCDADPTFIDPESGVCEQCDVCVDCLDWSDNCQCYTPVRREDDMPEDDDAALINWWKRELDKQEESANAE